MFHRLRMRLCCYVNGAMLSSETVQPFSCHYHVLIAHSQKEESLVSISLLFDEVVQLQGKWYGIYHEGWSDRSAANHCS